MGFWHTGYAEFHEPSGLDGYVFAPPPPVRYVCERCSVSFAELELLRKHRFEQHPVRQPALLVDGQPIGSLPRLVMTPLQPDSVLVEDASTCLLNGNPVEVTSLGQRLATMTREFTEVELRNDDIVIRIKLDFRVANETDLAGIEMAFLRLARDKALSIAALSRFIEDCRAFPSAMPYCDGICHYLYGVMAKELAPDSGLKQEQYVERFHRSTDELAGFDRPLARSIRALIAFHFNHFDEAEYLANEGALRHAAGAFSGLLQGLPWHFHQAFSPEPGNAVEDLLTDQETLQILADASHGLVELKLHAKALLAHARRVPTTTYDQMKRMLLAAEALAASEDTAFHAEARRLARELASRGDTSEWAKALLERLPTP